MPERKDSFTKSFYFDGKKYQARGKTLEEAIAKAAVMKSDLEAGREQFSSSMPVNQWFKQYMEIYKAGASDKTQKDYQGFYNNAIKPYIGALPLRAVKPANCQKIMNNLRGKSLSYVHKIEILLKGMFAAAVDNDLLMKNPAKSLTPPDAEAGERRALTKDERSLFLKACENKDNAGLFCKIVYYCGLRPSEVRALKGKNINYEKRIITITSGKTKAAKRNVPIPAVLELPVVPKEELLFRTSTGRPLDAGRVLAYWKSIKRQMEIEAGNKPDRYGRVTPKFVADDLTMYCLRHDYCTRLQEKNVPIDVARRLMGHSGISVTSKIYTHFSEMAFNDAVEKINS